MTTSTTPLPFLDLLDPGFDPVGPQVRAAREAHWCARTPVGLAVLRHAQVSALLSDRRLVQGSHHILSSQDLTDGPLVEWMNAIILTIEGEDHTRLRRLYNKAFTPRAVEALRPLMRRVADELVDRFVDGPGTRRHHDRVRRPLPGPDHLRADRRPRPVARPIPRLGQRPRTGLHLYRRDQPRADRVRARRAERGHRTADPPP